MRDVRLTMDKYDYKTKPKVPQEYKALYAVGEDLMYEMNMYFATWPIEDDKAVREAKLLKEHFIKADQIQDDTQRWFNNIALQILPHTIYDRAHVNHLIRRVIAAIGGKIFYEEYKYPLSKGVINHNVEIEVEINKAKTEASEVMNIALRLVRTAVIPKESSYGSLPYATTGYTPNTAFILMWMDKNRPELVDVHETVKEVFAEFDIKALRADEIQHQERITDLILEQISRAEFLFADLSGERPNVYYEVGYAHAQGKRPILYRRSGTPLHFDLSVHNVPEYANVTELRKMLRERLCAITGQSAKN